MRLAGAAMAVPAFAQKRPLDLAQFEPRSTLHASATAVQRARFPLIDFHAHLSWGDPAGETNRLIMPAGELLKVMDAKNIGVMVNLTGGFGKSLEQSVQDLSRAHPDRFVVFTQPWFGKVAESGYAPWQGDELRRAHAAGARGLKVLKSLGLVVRDQGKLVPVDDRRFDPMWETAAALAMPVAIHTSDPEAFFTPIDRYNERFEELNAHPDWSFHGKDYPSDRELQEARFRVLARHPKTTFVVLHVGNAENLDYIAGAMQKYPNMNVEFGARIGELGRQPRATRKFFDRFQDRILFGTDAVPNGHEYPQQVFGERLYEIYFRFLETSDEYFDYAPAKVPPQGRWRIYGIALPENILKKVYWNNAARLLGRKLI
ncbi:MAG: amidohydrolase family protein [Acidobacteriia bacterium]|nr:amidohydrolase family protein [Terriglobia bacterium]